MKIAWLVPGFPGTGGGRMNAVICDELLRQGADLHLYSCGGGVPKTWQQTMELSQRIFDRTHDISSFDDADVVVCSDFGRERLLIDAFLRSKGQKVWYLILINREFGEALVASDHILASTPWLATEAKAVGCKKISLLVGPADTRNFYRLGAQYQRNNLCLVYPKKSGWVGVEALRYAQLLEPSIVAGPMGLGEEKWKGVNFVEFGIPGHDVAALRALYSKARMFICADGGSQWGMNCCLMESAMCGLPMVSTNWTGFSHIISEETAATVPWNHAPLEPGMDWMVRPDPLELGEKIVELFRNKEMQLALSNEAWKRVQLYDLVTWCQDFLEVVK